MRIKIQSIPHQAQVYDTVGDWRLDDDGSWIISVSQMSEWRYEFLVALHELVEMAYCVWNGISQKAVDEFDMEYEKNRKEGDLSEPGDSTDAPYYWGHQVASLIERVAALYLGVNWKLYNDEVEGL